MKEKVGKIQKASKYYENDWSAKCNLKFFYHQTLTSAKRSEKELASKANFCTFLQLYCSNKLKLCEKCKGYQTCPRTQV